MLKKVPMSVLSDPEQSSAVSHRSVSDAAATLPRSRPFLRRLMQLVRRTHLYFGLFLFPWAILYGVTGFLFNHPGFLPDTQVVTYSRGDLTGTAVEDWPRLEDQAAAVLTALNELKQPATPFKRTGGGVRYANRDVFNITVKADQRTIFVTFDPKSFTGVIRESNSRQAVPTPAPFATAKPEAAHQRGMGTPGSVKHEHTGVNITDSMSDRLKSAVPVLLERKGFPTGDITITNAPDIKFPVEAEGQVWTANYNPITTNVTGVLATERSDLSFRSFLLRMHLTRGYPGEWNTKWAWALGVDAIATTLCFWGISGLFMWWQIKSTRKAGLIVLTASAVLASILGLGMHHLLTA